MPPGREFGRFREKLPRVVLPVTSSTEQGRPTGVEAQEGCRVCEKVVCQPDVAVEVPVHPIAISANRDLAP